MLAPPIVDDPLGTKDVGMAERSVPIGQPIEPHALAEQSRPTTLRTSNLSCKLHLISSLVGRLRASYLLLGLIFLLPLFT